MLRRFSSWIASTGKSKPTTSVDVETLFLDNRVQDLLRKLTGLSSTKVFHFRQHSGKAKRPDYRLMTQEEFEEMQQNVTVRAKERLQIPPFKNPRSEEVHLIDSDPEIAGGDNAKHVFYDISPGLKPTDRLTVVREIDGRLRTGTGAERDRMYRTYFPSPNRPVLEPPVFEDPPLTEALNNGKYEFVLDFACWFFEPDDPKYVKVSTATYDHIDKAGLHEFLWSTRHYGALVFYLTINKRVDQLLTALLSNRKLTESADVIRLYKICHRDCKTADAKSDLELVKNFIKADSINPSHLSNVLQACEEAIRNETRTPQKQGAVGMKSSQ